MIHSSNQLTMMRVIRNIVHIALSAMFLAGLLLCLLLWCGSSTWEYRSIVLIASFALYRLMRWCWSGIKNDE